MKKCMFLVAAVVVGVGANAFAKTIWVENFSDVDDWAVISDPGQGASITSDGNLGSLNVKASSNLAAFVAAADVSPYIPFDPAKKQQYSLTFSVEKITASASYDISVDVFGEPSSGGYLSTVWHVFPESGSSISTGVRVVNLGEFEFDPAAKFILPKITVHSGEGDQTVKFDIMQVDLNP